MEKQNLEIGHPLKLTVYWYDKVPEPPEEIVYEGEVVGWRQSQLVVRVPNYSVVRFWKKNGLEVGNPDHARRGFRLDLSELTPTSFHATNNQEIEVEMPVATDTEA